MPLMHQPRVETEINWIKAVRLQKLADAGDKKAAKEIKRMEATVMVPLEVRNAED